MKKSLALFLVLAFMGMSAASARPACQGGQQVQFKERPKPPLEPALNPDLIIASEHMQQGLQNIQATAQIANIGLSGASIPAGKVIAELAAFGGTYTISTPGGGVYIAPKTKYEVKATLPVPAAGAYSVTWKADPRGILKESNESNNERVSQWQVVNMLPDLAISQVSAAPVPGSPAGSCMMDFSFTITNLGYVSIPYRTVEFIRIKLDGQYVNIVKSWVAKDLEPSASIQMKARTSQLVPAGDHQAVISLDSWGQLAELREDNNEATLDFQVPASVGGGGLLPDLVVSITVSPQSGPPDTHFLFSLTVTNIGDAVAPGGGSQLCRVTLDGLAGFPCEVVNASYKNLANGQSVTHTVRLLQPLARGTHTFSATVDASLYLDEKNESNNKAQVTFIVN